MSSRFIKKVAETYKTNDPEIVELDDPEQSVSPVQRRNKFNMELLDISDSSDELADRKENLSVKSSKEAKSKTKKKSQKSKKKIDPYLNMTEDKFIEKFTSENASFIAEKTTGSDTESSLLHIRLRRLNEAPELQQMFGTPAAANPATAGHPASRLGSIFGRREPHWPSVPATKLGLSMRVRPDGWAVVEYDSETYQEQDRALSNAIHRGPENGQAPLDLQQLMEKQPYHAATLLYTASVLLAQEEYSRSGDCWRRIFHLFQLLVPSGHCLVRVLGATGGASPVSLHYRHRLNRAVFLALFQWILHLCHKSCFSTALEHCKLLLGLDVQHDPLAIVLMLDDVALRADEYDFLMEFGVEFGASKRLELLPNWAFSRALCCHFRGQQQKQQSQAEWTERADTELQQALARFPGLLSRLMELCRVESQDEQLLQCPLFGPLSAGRDPAALVLLLELYVKRSLNLWKNTSVLRWLEVNAGKLARRFNSEEDQKQAILRERARVVKIYDGALPLAVKRHVALSGHGELLREDMDNSNYIIYDPFPPANSEGGHDPYQREVHIEHNLDSPWWINLFRSMMPSFH